MRSLVLATIGCAVLSSPPALARRTDFKESHLAILASAGTYFHWLPNDNAFDPVPGATPTSGTVTGSADTYLLPVRFGLLRDSPVGGFGIYFDYMLNMPRATWDVTGTPAGGGTTAFLGKGVGVEASVPIYQTPRVRVNFLANAEYVWQTAKLTFTATGGTAETLSLASRSLLAGAGFQPEFWVGDQYVFLLQAAYQYGFRRTWNVATAASFMGNAYAAGELSNPTSGDPVAAEFGGFYFGAGFKLNFQ